MKSSAIFVSLLSLLFVTEVFAEAKVPSVQYVKKSEKGSPTATPIISHYTSSLLRITLPQTNPLDSSSLTDASANTSSKLVPLQQRVESSSSEKSFDTKAISSTIGYERVNLEKLGAKPNSDGNFTKFTKTDDSNSTSSAISPSDHPVPPSVRTASLRPPLSPSTSASATVSSVVPSSESSWPSTVLTSISSQSVNSRPDLDDVEETITYQGRK
jgi:hypothetical protein